MADHKVTVIVNAPVEQVYPLFTHFNDFPKFMHFVKEVTYKDAQTSHWVAEIFGRHEWDAVNADWQANQQIGWKSISGLENHGAVTFQSVNNNQTQVTVDIHYTPPVGVLGAIGENLGAGSKFEKALQEDMNHFAKMVQDAPDGALDPTSSSYLFNQRSAAAEGATTPEQNATM